MRRSKSEIYFHFVWATWKRRPWIASAFERELYRCIQDQVQKQSGVVLALNGMPDHVHLIAKVPATLMPSHLMKQIKGVSSVFVNERFEVEEHFRWQEGYAVFSLSRSHVTRAVKYVQCQKHHHANGSLWPQWEETDEEIGEITRH